MRYDLVSITGFLILAAWDGLRRYLADRSSARIHDLEKSLRLEQELSAARRAEALSAAALGAEIKELVPWLRDRQKTMEQALSQFVTQATELVRFTEDRRVEAEKKAVRSGFGK